MPDQGSRDLERQAHQTRQGPDQRTRERLPALDTFARAALDHHRHRLACLEALRAVPQGAAFTVAGGAFVRTEHGGDSARDAAGKLIHFDRAEHRAFWAWAAVEFLRHTGARIEEMLEASHHALVQYRLPTTGEIVPLLQIAPSKNDQERVLLVSPELADVLSAVIRRVRDPKTGTIPLLAAYDYEERTWSPPAPLLFQWDWAGERSRMTGELIRRALGEVLNFIGLADTTGQPLDFAPHDFRRMFITDAIRSGLPPHIAQVIAGHADINTTMGYNAVYPTETIEAHRAFINRRRTLRPAEEYRPPPTPSGKTSSATLNAANSPSEPAPAPTAPPASTNTPASAAPSYAPTLPNVVGSWRSATTSSTASPKPSERAGSVKSRACASASLAPNPRSTRSTPPPEARQSTSACHARPQLNPPDGREQRTAETMAGWSAMRSGSTATPEATVARSWWSLISMEHRSPD